ncbi:MAG: methionine--tRNA ligase, partial [Planctomycetota bacterium]
MGTISFEEFLRIEMRVGRVESVEDHPGADRLYILRVNIGDRTIQTVAGLKPYMSKEALKGRLVVVVVNLEPAMLRGVRSEGMILAAQEGERVVLLVPDG